MYLQMRFLQQSFGCTGSRFVRPHHRLVGVERHLGGHQSPLDRLAGPSDLALVVDDGSTQLARVSLSRAIGPGLDQKVTASLRWNSVVDGMGLLLQQQHLEVLWHRRSRRGGCCTRWTMLATPKPRVSLSPPHPRCVTYQTNGNLAAHVQPGQQCSQVKEAWHLWFDSNGCERAVLCCCEVCWVPRCRPVAYHVSKIQWCPSARLRISPVCGQVSSIVISLCCPRRVTAVLLRSVRSWQNGCSSCTGSNRVRLAMPRTLTNRSFLFSQRSRASSQGFCSCSSVLCRDSVSMLSVSGGLRSDVEAIHKCILSCCELSQVAR